ncbi:MAG: hypothetical protein JKY83_00090 [Rhizobiaceae bacterium]|nr:hypothetical protein [Rhizobiaceae bacterium]
MQIKSSENINDTREAILHEGCHDLIKSMRKVEPAQFLMVFYSGQTLGIGEMLRERIEGHFKANTVSFEFTGECDVPWVGNFTVALDLELLHLGVFAFFRLYLCGNESSVELNHISFETAGIDPLENTKLLEKAIQAARA